MFAALMRLLPLAMGEGGGLASSLGRAGMAQAAAEQGAVAAPAAQAAEQASVGSRIKSGAAVDPQQRMNFWLRQNRGQANPPPQMQQIGQQIAAGMGGGGGKAPPPNTAGISPAGANQPGNQGLQLQKQSNQLQTKSNQLVTTQIQQMKLWLAENLKFMLTQQGLAKIVNTVASAVTAFNKALNPFNTREWMKGLFSLSILLPKLAYNFMLFAENISESNRGLKNWNGAIAASFNRLDIKRQGLQIQQGRATQGSTTLLNDQLGKLLEGVQPITNSVATIANLAATGLAFAARVIAEIAKNNPFIKGAMDALKDIENKLAKEPRVRPDDMGRGALFDLRHATPGVGPGVFPPNIPQNPRQPLPRLKAPFL